MTSRAAPPRSDSEPVPVVADATFHVVPGPASGARLLLVSYHFPPGATAGALRWQKLLPLLAEYGWRFDVVTQDPMQLPASDPERVTELPPGTRIFAVRSGAGWIERADAALARLRQRRWARPPGTCEASSGPTTEMPESIAPTEMRWWPDRLGMKRLYGALLLQSRERAWANAAARIARAVAAESPPRAVITSGPPHLTHEAGRLLATVLGVPLVLDYRDPWTPSRRLPEAYATPLYFALARYSERRVVRAASLLVTTTEAISEALRATYPGVRVATVMNGYDEPPTPVAAAQRRFTIAYAGNIYLDRDPRPLFRAAARLVAHASLTPDCFGIELVGEVQQYGGIRVASLAQQHGIAQFVRLRRSLPRRALSQLLAEAVVLVSFPQDSPFAIPSKIFEYMTFPAWLLVLSPPGTPTARVLEGTDAAVVSPHDNERLFAVLAAWQAAFARGDRPAPLAQRARFSRRRQAEVLAKELAYVAGDPRANTGP